MSIKKHYVYVIPQYQHQDMYQYTSVHKYVNLYIYIYKCMNGSKPPTPESSTIKMDVPNR